MGGEPIFLSLCTLPSSLKSERQVLSEHMVMGVGRGAHSVGKVQYLEEASNCLGDRGKSGKPLLSKV